jgi:glutathione S-transferase
MDRFPDAWTRRFGGYLRMRYGLDRPGALERARAAVAPAFDRLERELGGRDHLVGDAFTVADLTAASHLYWLIQPPEGPRVVSRLPRELDAFMEPFRERRGYRWVLETDRRHRRPAAEQQAAAAPAEPAVA